MKPAAFEYAAPAALAEALALKAEHGDEAKFLAGGQSLMPTMNFRLAQPAILIDINGIDGVAGIRPGDAGRSRIGALTRYRTLERDAAFARAFPLVAEALPHIAHPQIRNRGTIGGNLSHADPASEFPAITLALQARDEFCSGADHRSMRPRPLVAASVGPYGAMLADGSEYRGGYAIDDRELEAFHRPRLEVLAGSGADLLAFETIPCLREALVLARLLEEFPSMSAWMSFSCRDGRRNCEGEAIGTCAAALGRYDQIGAIGINCTRPEFAASLIANLRTATDKPLVAYPNSGERYDALTKTWHGHAVHDGERALPFAELSKAWVEAGARLIGGCCRTTPEDIAELAAR